MFASKAMQPVIKHIKTILNVKPAIRRYHPLSVSNVALLAALWNTGRKNQHILKLRWLKMVARGQSSRQGIVQHQWNVLLLADFEGRTTRVVRNDNIRALLFHKGVDWSPRSCTGVLLFSGPGPITVETPKSLNFVAIQTNGGNYPLEKGRCSSIETVVSVAQVVGEGQAIFKTKSGYTWNDLPPQALEVHNGAHNIVFGRSGVRVKRLLAASSSKPPTQRKSFQSLPGVDQSNLTVDMPGKKK